MPDQLSDRLLVDSMAAVLDLQTVKLDDEAAVAGCLLRAGYRGATIDRFMSQTIRRACELRTLRTTLAPAIDCSGEVPAAANEGPPQQATR